MRAIVGKGGVGGRSSERRRELNALILEYALAQRILPQSIFSPPLPNPRPTSWPLEYSNDGLHLTTAGYRLFADLVYQQVLQPVFQSPRRSNVSCLQPVTDADFDRVVERATVPVLVEFWKPGCGSCRALMRELEKLESELDRRC